MPVESETGLRNLAWIEDNRRKVDQMTDGKVAYVYLPDTGVGGYTNFNRYFFAQVDKDGAGPRRALQRRRQGGRLRHRLPPPAAAELLDGPRRQDLHDARRRDLRAEGDDHQRVRRLRRRRHAVVLPQGQASARWSASGPGAAWSASPATRR